MSLYSFFARTVSDPGYPLRRMQWEAWRWTSERDVQVSSLHGAMSFSSKDQIIGRALYLTREFAMRDIETACRILVQEGKLSRTGNACLLDIGANIGTNCVPLLKNGLFKSAWAFEPEEKNVSYLLKNIRQNHLEKAVQVFPFALSDTAGTAELLMSDSNYGDHRVQVGTSAGGSELKQRAKKKIEIKMLDEIMAQPENIQTEVSLIWLDTQGHEAKILRGARTLLSKGVPMVTEFWPEGIENSGESIDTFCTELTRHYRFFFDLREKEPIKRPCSELLTLAREYAKNRDYTDLVLIN